MGTAAPTKDSLAPDPGREDVLRLHVGGKTRMVSVCRLETVDDLRDKIGFYLSHFDRARAIAERGHQTVQPHTTVAFAKAVLAILEEQRRGVPV